LTKAYILYYLMQDHQTW